MNWTQKTSGNAEERKDKDQKEENADTQRFARKRDREKVGASLRSLRSTEDNSEQESDRREASTNPCIVPQPRGTMTVLGGSLAIASRLLLSVRRVGFKLTGFGLLSFKRIRYLRTTAAVQLISTRESPGRFATATVVRAGPPFGKYVLKTAFIPS
jgi:hypothetical protein